MGLFDAFKKKECSICGGEIGILGNRKLEDGNCCKHCARKLSPWFEDRRKSTVEQIKEQLAYREQNARELEGFVISRIVGESYKMYIEEVNDVPVRFFVTDASDYMAANPDIISFKDVISCVTDIDVHDQEMKRKDDQGNMVSYNPPRYEHHYDFYMKMQIRNNPYFDDIRFNVNRGVVTLETVGVGGSLLGRPAATAKTISFSNNREQKRYNEYEQMCRIIEQAVEDGKRGAVPAAAPINQPEPIPTPVQEAPRPKFCQNCGAPSDGGKFCQHCGSAL